jgi:hypothetical protein
MSATMPASNLTTQLLKYIYSKKSVRQLDLDRLFYEDISKILEFFEKDGLIKRKQ